MSSLLKKILKPAFKAVANIGLGNPHIFCEVEFMEAGVKPVAIIGDSDVSVRMKELIKEGQIIHIGDFDPSDGTIVQVYAQADKVDDGKELYARYYKDDEGYPPLESKEKLKRIGQLLGYTENDISWALEKKYQNNFVRAILIKTLDWRRNIRKEYMLNYSNNTLK